MAKTTFKTQEEFDLYKVEQKERMEKGFLTVSERNTLKPMLEKEYKPTIVKEELPKGKSLVTNYKELRKSCILVEKEEDIKPILQDLKDTLNKIGGLGLSINQIGINKRISYLKIPTYDQKTKESGLKEYYIINAKIIEQSRPIKIPKEMCLSFPDLGITTKRYVFIVVSYLDENFKERTLLAQDIEAIALQHEIDHQNGITILDRKWRSM